MSSIWHWITCLILFSRLCIYCTESGWLITAAEVNHTAPLLKCALPSPLPEVLYAPFTISSILKSLPSRLTSNTSSSVIAFNLIPQLDVIPFLLESPLYVPLTAIICLTVEQPLLWWKVTKHQNCILFNIQYIKMWQAYIISQHFFFSWEHKNTAHLALYWTAGIESQRRCEKCSNAPGQSQ